MSFEDEMDFEEVEAGEAMSDETRGKLVKLLETPCATSASCSALVSEDIDANCEAEKGARRITLKVDDKRKTITTFTCSKEEYDNLCKTYNASDTLVGKTVKVIRSSGIIIGIC